eukprot:TRINITY_DN1553_c0_g1_i1.p3 TRINITY_DN1553_c0_g1~~TRINITY_DN1553_c0_g1_i1.p3  ORF type:complete len:157 (+),score=34.76 TRINITY_DN1553_c0_g1_i1:46-516(+)
MGGPCIVGGKQVPATDNFGISPFVLDGQEWMSAEQYFQAKKFVDEGHREKIRAERSGTKQWQLGNSRAHRILPNWEQIKVDVMYEANKAKFEQNPKLAAELVASSGPIVAQGFPFWAQWNGVLLSRLREELRPVAERDLSALNAATAAMDEYRSSH